MDIIHHQLRFLFLSSKLAIILCLIPCVLYSQSGITDDNAPESVEELLKGVDEWIFNDPPLARNYAKQALELSRKTEIPDELIKSLYAYGEVLMRASELNEALPLFEEGFDIAEEINDQMLIARGLYNLSRHSEAVADFPEAISRALRSKSIYEELGMEPEVANSSNSLGRIYQELGDFSTSLTYLFEALRINEKLERKTNSAISHTIIGNTYLKNGNYDEATRHFHLALALDEEMEDNTGIMISKLNLGAAYQRNEDYDAAMKYHQEALELARLLEFKEDEAIILGNIGSTYRKLGRAESGLPYMFEGLAIMRETGYNTTPTLNNITEAYLALEDYDQALSYALEAEQSGSDRSDLDRLRYTYLNMASAYEGLRNFESANRSLRKYIETRDSLFTIEREKQINELEILYETEQRDQTIAMLTLEAETATFRRNTFLASGILVSLILLLLYSGQRYKTRKNRQLFEKSEEVARMKSSFFSNISHEFRTPLTLISGPIDKLLQHSDDPVIQKELKLMQKNSERLLSLINQLLDLSRLESGSLSLSVSKTDLFSLVRGVAMSFESLAEMKQIRISVETDDSMSTGWVDRGKLETILINLMGNALKFSPREGEVRVKIAGIHDKNGLDYCQIVVSDNGEGIPAKDLDHVFDRFFRGSENELSGTVGSGIGLALTRELVLLHKGEISVNSTPGKGTEFTVKLPVSKITYSEQELIPASPTESIPMSVISESESPINKSGDIFTDTSVPLLLLIEDNPDVMNYLTGILGDLYRIITAPDGEAGVEAAFREIPDIIISDVMMPKMDGHQVAEILKQDAKTSHIPLILLTAKASHDDKIKGLQTQADDYVTKPFRPDELKLRVNNLLSARKKMREKYNRKIEVRPDELSAESMEESFLKKVVGAINKHLVDEDFSVDQLAGDVGMSRSQLHRKLIALTDQSATDFIRSYRLNLAREKIENHTGTISEIAYEVGFNSPSYFSKAFKDKFGVSPSEYESGKRSE
jgi:signal transduction histidine kinase/DNA-binding response OmpR family regulator